MPRNYVDNSYNRCIGRVGMAVGSMVVSRGASGDGGGMASSSGSGIGYSSSSNIGYGSSSGTGPTTPKTYVDNAYNRSYDRVGLEHGTAVVQKSQPASPATFAHEKTTNSPKTYVDNAYNRSYDRVGLEHGTAVVQKSQPASPATFAHEKTTNSPKTYVDNAYNRSYGRVGLEHGTAVVSKQKEDATPTRTSSQDKGEPKRYTDTGAISKSDRAGKPVSTSDLGSKTGTPAPSLYADNQLNRKLGRVGKAKGSQPISSTERGKPKSVKNPSKSRGDEDDRRYRNVGSEDVGHDDARYAEPEPYFYNPYYFHATGHIQNLLNRKIEEIEWADKRDNTEVKTAHTVISDYSGTEIPYAELDMGRKIGEGGFGEVYFAKWKKSIVAVKKLAVNKMSKRRNEEFASEVMRFCKLDHENIVQFIGACVKQPDLCIVMEYMQISLFDALHIENCVEFSEKERLQIIRQTCRGLQYLHSEGMAHCDLKSPNVLLNYTKDVVCTAKLTDFGLSMVKSNIETSSSAAAERVSHVGTPRYAAPEVLRGELMSTESFLKADVYSMALVAYEVVYEEEPFYDLSYAQLQKQVGEKGLKVDTLTGNKVIGTVNAALLEAWDFKPEKRPDVSKFTKVFEDTDLIYTPQKLSNNLL